MADPNVLQRFNSKINFDGTCWLWTGSLDHTGYGKFYLNGKLRAAHRVAYELHVGPIPDGRYVDHLCFNRACVRTGHLRIATPKQNLEHRKGAAANSVSGVRGVYPNTCSNRRWVAEVRSAGQLAWRAYFDDLDEAAQAVAAARSRLLPYSTEKQWSAT